MRRFDVTGTVGNFLETKHGLMVSDEFPAVSITEASIWKHQGCAWWVIDWIQTYYLARILAARPSLFCLVRSS